MGGADEFEGQMKRDFLAEAKELLSNAEQCFLDLEKSTDDAEVLNRIFRLAHNLKGSAGAVGFSALADFAHRLESLLLAVKEKRVPISKRIVDLLLRSNDHLAKTIELLDEDLGADCQAPELSQELVSATEPSADLETERARPQAEAASEEPEAPAPIGKDERQPLGLRGETQRHDSAKKDESVRVNISRIERLLNNVGELSILQAVMTEQSLEKGSSISPLMRETLGAMAKIIKDTQSLSMSLRMLPVRQTFQKMQRIVRDTSKALGKEVALHLSGEDTEVDKTVLEQLGDPLVHLVRNAVDHGIESPLGRREAGKSPSGHLWLSAYHRAGQVVIEVREDGKGLDPEKLVARAKERGILAPDAALEPEEAYRLIFAPGFSTKDEVTDVSGRGVGMDVVQTNVSALQGQIEVETELGKGTCFRISLPLTLAIVDGATVRVGAERYVIPLAQVSEFFRPADAEMTLVYGRSELLTLREQSLAAFRLSTLLGLDESERSRPKKASDLTALIVDDGRGAKFAVLVDRVLSQQQVVIKALGSEISGRAGLMGSAILGDGKPAMILDLLELTKSIRGTDAKKHRAAKDREAS